MQKVLFYIFCFFPIIFYAQEETKEKLNFFLLSALESISEGQELNVTIHGEMEELVAFALTKRTKFYPFENALMLKLNKEEILALNEKDFIEHVEFDIAKPEILNDQMLINNNVIPVHQGIDPLNSDYSGKGVLVGVIDSGIELLHPDFLDDDNKTRVLYLWDHLVEDSLDLIPSEYGYGNVWSKEQIDAGFSNHSDQIQYFGHGSVVTGVAASDGSAIGQFKGVAPDCELIVVNSDFSRADWASSIADAVDFIFSKAQELGMPCVINASLGSYYGSHDGLDANALAIDALIEQEPGRAFVCAAGNSGSISPYHLSYEVNSDTSFTWFKYASNTVLGTGAVFFELWADTADFNQVQFAVAADKVSPSYSERAQSSFRNIQNNIDQVVSEDLLGTGGNTLGVFESWATIRGGQYQIQILLEEPDSSQYNYRFLTTGSGTFDLWSTSTFGSSSMVLENELPNSDVLPDIVHYKLPDEKQRIVSSWACSDKTLTVGNYVNRSEYVDYNNNLVDTGFDLGEISPTSSQGPTRDGKLKPDITATGAYTLSSGSFEMLNWLINNEPFKVAPGGFHNRNGGTSMASPVIAGVSALIFEQCPLSNYETILNAIQENGIADSFSGSVPNDLWGNGKIDGFGAVNSLTVNGNLEVFENQLIASGGEVYQWYFEDSLIHTGTSNVYAPIETGMYSLEIIDEKGCIDKEEVYFNFTSLGDLYANEIEIYPNPTSDFLRVRGDFQGFDPKLFDSIGAQVTIEYQKLSETLYEIDLGEISNGIYYLSMENVNSYPILVNHSN